MTVALKRFCTALAEGCTLISENITMKSMSAYKDALTIGIDDPGDRLTQAAEILASGVGVVIVEGMLALRPAGRELICEVIDPTPSAHRCINEYEVLVENARRALEASRLCALLPPVPRKWRVVEDQGTGAVEVWHVRG